MHRYIYLLFITNLWLTESAKILAISPVQSRSHNSIQQLLLQELASRGHEIISLSHFKLDLNLTNFQEILMPKNNDLSASFIDSQDVRKSDKFLGTLGTFFLGHNYVNKFYPQILRLDCIQKLVIQSEQVDLIIAEFYFSKYFHLLAYKLNVPLVAIIPTSTSVGSDNFLGNSFNPSYVAQNNGGYTMKMTFFQRLINSLHYFIMYGYQFSAYYDIKLQEVAENVLKMKLPTDDELIRRTAFGLYNNHFSFMPRPLTPNVVDIGGIHIEEPKPLTKDISEFIESAPHGVIFFSLGTNIRVDSIPMEKLRILLEVFSIIPQRVLWRVNELNLFDLPSNVKTGKWFPQRDILEHDNVVAFMSHCGLFGTFEAIHTATPVLAMPFTFDQPQNAKILVEKEVAVYLDFYTMSKEILLNSIKEITNNEKYKKNMKNLSKLFKDRPMSPLETAVYWIEYVIKHNGASHLRPLGADIPLYKYLLLDAIAFILIAFFLMLYLIKIFTRLMRRSLS